MLTFLLLLTGHGLGGREKFTHTHALVKVEFNLTGKSLCSVKSLIKK